MAAYQNDDDQVETIYYEEKAQEKAQNTAERVGEPMPASNETARNAYDVVPVGPRGASPNTLDQQVSYADAMARANTAIPAHLRKNIGACLAIVDIATRSNLSPFMLANKTYVQNDRLCFESQAIHALIENSGVLQSRLRVKYTGKIEDGTRACTVEGLLKGETSPHIHHGGTLAQLHPGYSHKVGDAKFGKKISYAEGQKLKAAAGDEKVPGLFVNGSPLWDRKPDVQLAYDAVRDWGRLYTPGALMGIMDQYEMQESGVEEMKEINPVEENVLRRLPGAQNGDGFNHGKVHDELDQVVGHSGGAKPKAAEPQPEKATKTKAGKQSVTTKAEPAQPTNAEEYKAYAERWFAKVKDPDDAMARWEGERELRDACKVPIKLRKQLEDAMAGKFLK